ncbi:DMT family transporter [Gulosibacter chungangensis]|nr:EamA family transporter [Gulosibacter chungangensis]
MSIAVLTAVAFACCGPFVKPLLLEGWSPTAAVLARLLGAAAILLPLGLIQTRHDPRVWLRRARWIAGYGIVAVGGSQLLYFSAVQLLPVSLALLIMYLAPVLLLFLAWARTRIRPAVMSLIGAGLSILGLLLALDIFGNQGGINWAGVCFAACAALTTCGYYLMAAAVPEDLPPAALIGGAMLVGTVMMVVLAALGLAPITATFGTVTMFGGEVAWWVPLLFVVVLGTAFAYLGGIKAARILGSRMASFFGLLEVVAAIVISVLLLGEVPAQVQLVGVALVVGGVICVRLAPDMVTVAAPLDPITAPITLPYLAKDAQPEFEPQVGTLGQADIAAISELGTHTGQLALVVPIPEAANSDLLADGTNADDTVAVSEEGHGETGHDIPLAELPVPIEPSLEEREPDPVAAALLRGPDLQSGLIDTIEVSETD